MALDQDVPDAVVALVESFEGFSASPYLCPAGVWTIGYGSTRDITGKAVCKTTKAVSQDQAALLARRDLAGAAREVDNDVTVPLTDDQKGALEDFVYNLGGGNFRSSTLLVKLNAGDFAGAASEFDKWDHASGRVLAGLLRRRQAETDLFSKDLTT